MKKLLRIVLVAITGIFGATSCYGCPYAAYDYKIKVKDEAGRPIEGIKGHPSGKLTSYPDGSWEYNYPNEYSDSRGVIRQFQTTEGYLDEITYVLEDVDGPENRGEFETRTLTEDELEISSRRSNKAWLMGEAITVVKATVTMKKKTTEN